MSNRPFAISLAIFIALNAIVFVLWILYPNFRNYYRPEFLLPIFFGAAFISFVTYQSLKAQELRRVLAEVAAKGISANSQELSSELYRNSPLPYVLIDRNGSVESMNSSAARLFKVHIDALNYENFFTLIKAEDETRTALIGEYCKQGKSVNDSEVSIRCSDGSEKIVMLSHFSFHDAQGSQKGLLALVDITKQKQVDKAKTEFVSLASHQLRTPISSMKWNLELLLNEGKEHFSDTEKVYAEKISRNLVRMDMLVNDFLSVSRLELGTLTATLEPLELTSFLKNIYEEQVANAERRNISLETAIEEELGSINSDSHLLHMIMSNLLSNAVKYTGDGGHVSFRAYRKNNSIVMTVSDTGMGIPQAEQEMLFSKLFRATNAREHVTEGTGLGLYIVKEAVGILGGEISFESTEGIGTTFTVALPDKL
jgi:PAS domain S-box-containing protein